MTFGTKPVTSVDCTTVWDLDSSSLARDDRGPQGYVGQDYTQCAWIKWRESSETGRTLFRGSQDHAVRVGHGTNQLGMFSNRQDGADRFKGVDFDITPNAWQFVCVVGKGESENSFTGVSEFYVG